MDIIISHRRRVPVLRICRRWLNFIANTHPWPRDMLHLVVVACGGFGWAMNLDTFFCFSRFALPRLWPNIWAAQCRASLFLALGAYLGWGNHGTCFSLFSLGSLLVSHGFRPNHWARVALRAPKLWLGLGLMMVVFILMIMVVSNGWGVVERHAPHGAVKHRHTNV